jgi:chromatin structure-remodeling complex protein RSC7
MAACSVFNSRLSAVRLGNLPGLYDIHTNTMQLPSHMQPTRAVFEPVLDGDQPVAARSTRDDDAASGGSGGDNSAASPVVLTPESSASTPAHGPAAADSPAAPPRAPAPAAPSSSTAFPPLPSRVARNYFVVDTYMRNPGSGLASAAYDTPDPDDFLAPFRGLSAVSDEIRALLPPECRAEFDRARGQETAWRERWKEDRRREHETRRPLVIDRTVQPYSVAPRDV